MNQGVERRLLVLGLLLVVCGCRTVPRGTAPTAPLRFPQDTFAFANETVLAYQDGRVVAETELRTERAPRRYTRSCFVMARGVIQFWKFARFVPDAPPLPEAELGRRIGRLAHRAHLITITGESYRAQDRARLLRKAG